jgi:hypothetical protein
MKRTGFAPKFQPRPAKIIGDGYTLRPRGPACARSDGKARMVVQIPKATPVESEPYRRLVAARPCINCGLELYSQAAHPNTNKAKGAKADDRLCFPLCHVGGNSCHPRFDLYQLYGRAMQSDLEPRWARETQRAIVSDGAWPAGLPLPARLIEEETER